MLKRQKEGIIEYGLKKNSQQSCMPECLVASKKVLLNNKNEQLLKSKYPNARFLSDIASGFNQNRRGYKTFLELALNGNSLHLVATTSDRITRSGFQLIK
ncbi:MAG: hypothetical protein ABFS56_33245 [Pseudomonadota bacterium]